ncbi:MAG: tyrosine-type recombinase/integrase [Proteobacteria bacterium]|nr:tyrosine-type recombinase/integrase [Pseudomonadota bacterium]
MKTIGFPSCLADEMTRFAELKQLSGSDYHSSAMLPLRFDRHPRATAFEGKAPTGAVFRSYFDTMGHLCGRGFTNRYSVLRQFSARLNQCETDSRILEERRTVDRSHSRPPYIFSPDEIKAVIEKSGGFAGVELVPGLCRTLFRLLCGTGIRIGEALALKRGGYIGRERLVHIGKGKFRRERYPVLAGSMADRLNKYLRRCEKKLHPTGESPLFVNLRGNPLSCRNARRAFPATLDRSGIAGSVGGPGIHDFRHAFAVHRLLRWHETERDANAKPPFPSTHMGHADIASTQVHLDAPNGLLRAGTGRFHRFFANRAKQHGGSL